MLYVLEVVRILRNYVGLDLTVLILTDVCVLKAAKAELVFVLQLLVCIAVS